MKKLLIFCGLYFAALPLYADTCPAPTTDSGGFQSAYWLKENNNDRQPVRCDYYNKQLHTSRTYTEDQISKHYQWKKIGSWYQCSDFHTQNEKYCPFG